ncbi:MAG: hypothetical protein ABMA15_07675 [Vicinamibacterales bacterium]
MEAPRFQWHVFFVALPVTIACVAAFWTTIPPTYLTNDDVFIRLSIEGLTAPGAAPTGFVVMAHSLLGWALVAMQNVVSVHVWDVMVAALLVWSIAIALTIVWTSSGPERAPRIAGILAMLVAFVPLMSGMQFTISATLAGAVAAALAATELFSAAPRVSVLVMSTSLLLLGLLVRLMGTAAGAVLMTTLLAPLVFNARAVQTPRAVRLGAMLTIVIALTGTLLYLDGSLYGLHDEWSVYFQNAWKTARLFEWGGDVPLDALNAMRARVGWSANDWQTLKGWWGIDTQVHSIARIADAYDAWADLAGWRARAESLGSRLTRVDQATFARLVGESAFPLAAGLAFAAIRASRRNAAAIGATLAVFFVACVAIEIGFKELPFRLFAPLQAGLVLAIVVVAGSRGRTAPRTVQFAAGIVLVALLARSGWVVATETIGDVLHANAIDRQVAEVLALRPSLLVLHADAFPSEHWWRPFHTPPVTLAAIQLGQYQHNPLIDDYLSRSGRQPLLRAICTDRSILVVSEEGRLQPATTFIREHYGIEVEWTEVFAGSFRVWRCTPDT